MYRQEYVVFLRSKASKITHLREYFDPVRAAKALGGADFRGLGLKVATPAARPDFRCGPRPKRHAALFDGGGATLWDRWKIRPGPGEVPDP